MIKVILARLRQGHRTMKYPAAPPPPMPPRFRGRPFLDPAKCEAGCEACASACPTTAISRSDKVEVDLGRCLFCMDCREACPAATIDHDRDYRLATSGRDDLIVGMERGSSPSSPALGPSERGSALPTSAPAATELEPLRLARALEGRTRKLFGRSLKLRQVSAGGCNACEADVNVLGTIGWDLGRFGVQIVASPRHADGLLVTGPVTRNMALALMKTYDALPDPRIVIAVGACAISGGPYLGRPEAEDGVCGLLPVDLLVPGCPPHPLTILDGILRLLGRIDS